MLLKHLMRLLLAGLLQAPIAWPQTILSVQQHFDTLVNHYDPAGPPVQLDRGEDLEAAIKLSRPEDLSAALPLIFTALAHPDNAVKSDGGMALIGIGQRVDSAQLLKPFLGKLYDLLGTDAYARFSLLVLDELRPAPPPETVPRLLGFLRRTDRDTSVQTGAVGFLLKHAPGDEQVLAAVQQFAARPLNPESRVRLLDVITSLLKGNERVLPVLVASLHDPTPAVRSRAIYDLSRLGNEVLGKYAADLQRIAIDPNEPQEVRASADRALGVWSGRIDPNRP